MNKRTWLLVLVLGVLAIIFILKPRFGQNPITHSDLVPIEVSKEAVLSSDEKVSKTQDIEPKKEDVAPGSDSPLSQRAKVYTNQLPPNFPVPKEKGEYKYETGGTPERPTLKLQNGSIVVLDPSPELVPKDPELLEKLKPYTLEEKLKDPAYRKALIDLGAIPDDRSSFFKLPEVFRR